ncbi:Conserved hypothetical protein [Clostridium acetobutylicum EA 2018]|uniref:Uncharacterized protein n=1 Tax=Clostridium acetobutylicum (strain ATCC 824 / DSM 792 / JCM 1419 / IAM 19013 / LMG 5710 / NBRC 13948 / NRRL B-527 / VKM B-1787 / 2291 / W) TaxID=272562 RepID=Q97HD3_CLOAB|nr:Hypothetical protein CA_C2079 [Clostridium acetobutylicum ATCC 824]ADZ21130.1 Conserved hypothetical protein [Clostridium acetobutylicum EA 2018]AEI32172.1 hypothetical protein SMB_G2112 [Clostridium acetobutylicum DSM 1731]AWV79534.1 hypothetical protein DK921_05350 [Clostridium acetobutylicum]PSM07494.1 hypothetical protein C7T89_05350 [Clostridium sp. NJ4]
MWCSILVREMLFEGGAKNPLKGTSMKFLVLALECPVLGLCWELKKLGHSQWHATNDPTFVEANYCILREIFNIRNWGKPAMWCKSYVQCSLP